MNVLNNRKRLLLLVTYFVIQYLSSFYFQIVIYLDLVTSYKTLVFLNVLVFLILALVLLWIVKKELVTDVYIAKHNNRFWLTSLKYLGLAFLTVFVANFIVFLITQEMGTSLNQESVELMVFNSPILLFFMVVILAPIIEELVFRYAIINLNSSYRHLQLIISSLIFGLVHIMSALSTGYFEELVYLIIYGALGFVLGLSYLKTNTILTPIIVHSIYNAFGFIAIIANG